MKRKLAIVLCMALFINTFSFASVFATQTCPDVALVTTGTTFNQGDIMSVALTLTGATSNYAGGITSFEGYLRFDPTVLSVEAQTTGYRLLLSQYTTAGTLAPNGSSGDLDVMLYSTGLLKIIYIDNSLSNPIVTDSVLFSINFHVSATATSGSTNITWNDTSGDSTLCVFNDGANELESTSGDLAVTITDGSTTTTEATTTTTTTTTEPTTTTTTSTEPPAQPTYGETSTKSTAFGGMTIDTSITNSGDNNYTAKVTNDLGKIVSYIYNTPANGSNLGIGELNSISDAKGTTNFTYDSLSRLTSVLKTVGSVTMQNDYTYENGKLHSISQNGFTYYFEYNGFGDLKKVSVNATALVTYAYGTDFAHFPTSVTYGNGNVVQYFYTDKGTTDYVNYPATSKTIQYIYDDTGLLTQIKDNVNNRVTKYQGVTTTVWDITNAASPVLLQSYIKRDGSLIEITDNTYNSSYASTGKDISASFSDGANTANLSKVKDDFGRTSSDTVSKDDSTQVYKKGYNYTSPATNRTSTQVASIGYAFGTQTSPTTTEAYEYDDVGNVTAIKIGGATKQAFQYDGFNQLIREDNVYAGASYVYTYDNAGNMLTKSTYNGSYLGASLTGVTATSVKEYLHAAQGGTFNLSGWNDVLLGVGGVQNSYDDSGNALDYSNFNFTWQNGKELKTVGDDNSSLDVSYAYNEKGIRTSKTVNGVTTNYTIIENKITSQSCGTNKMYFFYDSDYNPVAFELNGTMYHYMTNLQGVITGILDASGIIVVKYAYDAWGNIVKVTDGSDVNKLTDASFIGNINPFRYKGYYFDTETGFYYLQSRYYDPAFGRFINADNTDVLSLTQGQLLGANLFTYCANNPVNNYYYEGNVNSGFLIKEDSVGYIVKLIQAKLNSSSALYEAIKETGQVDNFSVAKDGSYTTNVGALIAEFKGLVGILRKNTTTDVATYVSSSMPQYGSPNYSSSTTYSTPPAETTGIVNGKIYYIQNKSSNRFMIASGASHEQTVAYANISQWSFNNTYNMKWRAEILSSGEYVFHPLSNENMNLAINKDGPGQSIVVVGDKIANSPYNSSKWILYQNNGSYNLISYNSWHDNIFCEYTLANTTGTADVNSPLAMGTSKNDNSDNWVFIEASAVNCNNSDTYYIKNKQSGKFMTATSNCNSDGTSMVAQNSLTGSENQQFKFTYSLSEKEYVIHPISEPTKNLSACSKPGQPAATAGQTNAPIGLYSNRSDGTPYESSRWHISYNYGGKHSFYSKASNYKYTLTKIISTNADGNLTQFTPQPDDKNSATNDYSDDWIFIPIGSDNFSAEINRTPETKLRLDMIDQGEKEYNVWPAEYGTRFYGETAYNRQLELIKLVNVGYLGADAANAIFCADVSDMMRYFIDEGRVDYTVNFQRINKDWDYANVKRANQLNDAIIAAESFSLGSANTTFYNTLEYSNFVVNDSNTNFNKSIGSYYTSIKCVACVNASNHYTATIDYNLLDYYDWSRSTEKVGGLFSQDDMWELNYGGEGKNYKVKGTNRVAVTWVKGQRIGSGAVLTQIS